MSLTEDSEIMWDYSSATCGENDEYWLVIQESWLDGGSGDLRYITKSVEIEP